MRLSPALLVSVSCLLACDRAESSDVVRDRYVERHAETFTLRDRTRALEALTGVLEDEGYDLVPTARADHFTTNLRSHTQLSIHLISLVGGELLLQIAELTRDDRGEVTENLARPDLEWLVAQRAEPDRALAVMKKANERADKVPPITRKN